MFSTFRWPPASVHKIHLIILFFPIYWFAFDTYDLSSASYLSCQRDVGSKVLLTHTRSVQRPYLRMETHTHTHKFYYISWGKHAWCQLSQPSVHPAVWVSNPPGRKHIFGYFVLFLCPSLHLSPSPYICPSLYLHLDRSLSRHWDTNQDFLAVGTGSLVKEWEKKDRCLIIDNKRGI